MLWRNREKHPGRHRRKATWRSASSLDLAALVLTSFSLAITALVFIALRLPALIPAAYLLLIRATTDNVHPAWTRAAVHAGAIAPQDRKMDRFKLSASLAHRNIGTAAEETPIPTVDP